MDDQNVALLETALEAQYLPYLPTLLDMRKPPAEQLTKNLSRAFSAFALQSLCDITPKEAAEAVVDDYDDKGLDAIYYHAPTETLYLVQGKLRNSDAFGQEEALAFCQGVRKLINLDFDGFNDHVLQRRIEIEDALADCSHIKLAIAHIGTGVSKNASDAMSELILQEDSDEERIEHPWTDFDAARVMAALHASQAVTKIDGTLGLLKARSVEQPRLTYFGLIELQDLVALHDAHGAALYERNIRAFLGKRTPVNIAIRETLALRPDTFMYLNNGVTMLADIIEPKNSPGGRKRLKLRGISVVNGAQTIASSAQFRRENPASSIAGARVMLTIIKADSNGQFGKDVTRARNHQNPVESWNFAALDDEQERLRRELAHLGLHYAYKAASYDGSKTRPGFI